MIIPILVSIVLFLIPFLVLTYWPKKIMSTTDYLWFKTINGFYRWFYKTWISLLFMGFWWFVLVLTKV